MTDPLAPPVPVFGPLHPVARLGRVVQQLRSLTSMHARELEGIIGELEATGQREAAERVRAYRDLHAQEIQLVLDELADVRADMEREAKHGAEADAAEAEAAKPTDPAANSPRRARWLAEQAERSDAGPLSRRDFLTQPKSQT